MSGGDHSIFSSVMSDESLDATVAEIAESGAKFGVSAELRARVQKFIEWVKGSTIRHSILSTLTMVISKSINLTDLVTADAKTIEGYIQTLTSRVDVVVSQGIPFTLIGLVDKKAVVFKVWEEAVEAPPSRRERIGLYTHPVLGEMKSIIHCDRKATRDGLIAQMSSCMNEADLERWERSLEVYDWLVSPDITAALFGTSYDTPDAAHATLENLTALVASGEFDVVVSQHLPGCVLSLVNGRVDCVIWHPDHAKTLEEAEKQRRGK